MPANRQHGLVYGINVTPLVDVMLVLLIIFMVSAPMMKEGLKVDLPEVETRSLPSQSQDLIVTINKNDTIELNGTTIDRSRLPLILSQIKKQRKVDQVFLQADRRISYGYAVRVIGDIKKAGFTKIGLVTQLPRNRPKR